MLKPTFISSLSPYPTEEYYLGKNVWSGNINDWKQRFEVGDVVADPSGSWTPSTAEAYIDQQIATEATIRLDQDVYTRSLIPLADEEDLTKSGSYLKFKDRTYNQTSPNGMGRVILRNNIVNGVNILTQSMINQANTIYVIQYDFTLASDVTIPANCILEFDGGSISGSIVFSNSTIILGTPKIEKWFGAFRDSNGQWLDHDLKPFNINIKFDYSLYYSDFESDTTQVNQSIAIDDNYIYTICGDTNEYILYLCD